MISISYIVWKKTGGLDLMLPVLWKIRETYPNTKITLLIAEINKHHLIRDGMFYIRFCEHHHIELLDFLDFLPNWLRPFKGILCQLTKRTPEDGKSDNRLLDFLLCRLIKFLKQQIDYSRATSTVSSDLLFINDEWWDELARPLWDIILGCHKKIFLVQHGPIILATEKPTDMVEKIMLKEVILDNNLMFYQHWFETIKGIGVYRHVLHRKPFLGPYEVKYIPLSDMKISYQSTVQLERLTYLGFPGFDREWFNYLKRIIDSGSLSILPPKRRKFRCMLLTRSVLDAEGKRGRKSTTEDFKRILEAIRLIENNYDLEIIIKPHPKQNITYLKQFLMKMDIESYLVVNDSIYAVLPTIDFAITMQSSGAYYPLIYGVSCIHILKGKYEGWDYLFNDMESNLQSVINLDDLLSTCLKLIEDLTNTNPVKNDTAHMRKYYPDGAIELIMEQLHPYLRD